MSFFIIRHGNFQLGWVELSSAFSIGRHSASDLVLNDAMLSRNHFRFEKESERWVAADLDSKNGTWIDGRRISRETLGDGDLILAGRYSFEFREGVPEGKKYVPQKIARPADPREALQATMSGVVYSEKSPEIAGVSRRRPRPEPRPYPSVGLLEETPLEKPRSRFPILLELPGEDELSPSGDVVRRPASPVPEAEPTPRRRGTRWKINLDFAAFVMILVLLAAGSYMIWTYIPHW